MVGLWFLLFFLNKVFSFLVIWMILLLFILVILKVCWVMWICWKKIVILGKLLFMVRMENVCFGSFVFSLKFWK